jgi:phytanoyl-CoA hydroxylase
MKLSEEQISQFAADGFLVVERIVTDEQVDSIRAGMNRVYNGTYNRDMRPGAARGCVTPMGTSNSVRWILNARILDADLWEFTTDVDLGRAAAQLLRTSSVSVIEDDLLDKPGNSAPVNLHQDYSYWRFSTSANMVSCWLALSDMTEELGPLELVRRSHQWGFAERPKELMHGSDQEYDSAMKTILPEGTQPEFVPTVVPKGGGVFFHSLTFHGSRGNSTDQWRRAFALHWAGSGCLLDRSKLLSHHFPALFTGLKQGDPLVNKFIPRVYCA